MIPTTPLWLTHHLLAAAWKPILECLHPALLVFQLFSYLPQALRFLIAKHKELLFWPPKYANNVWQYFLFSYVSHSQNVGKQYSTVKVWLVSFFGQHWKYSW